MGVQRCHTTMPARFPSHTDAAPDLLNDCACSKDPKAGEAGDEPGLPLDLREDLPDAAGAFASAGAI